MAQGYEPFDAVVLGCFVHGMAGDMAKDEKGEMGMMAGDILRAIPYAFKALQDTALL
jgi:ADP-dependent NAD(P)H-hydrate dehydratase / NAD(P)H-hydrate epimerase